MKAIKILIMRSKELQKEVVAQGRVIINNTLFKIIYIDIINFILNFKKRVHLLLKSSILKTINGQRVWFRQQN